MNWLNVYNLLCKVLSTNPPLNSVPVPVGQEGRKAAEKWEGRVGRQGEKSKGGTMHVVTPGPHSGQSLRVSPTFL